MSLGHRAFLGIATLGVAALLVVMAMLQAGLPLGPNRKPKSAAFEARVVRFGSLPNPRWTSDKLIVVATTVDGRTGQGVIATARLDQLGCKVGDPVSAHMEGAVMVVDALSCNRSLR